MSRWRYQGESPAILREQDRFKGFFFERELAPGDEFDAPDGWVPEPNPHPLYVPVSDAFAKPTAPPSPQESEEA